MPLAHARRPGRIIIRTGLPSFTAPGDGQWPRHVAEAVRLGWANRAYPADELDEQVLATATRIAKTGPDLFQINKRSVHRAMEVMGIRTAIRAGTELRDEATW
jgi:enoyl-CoA hydratase/carnithine racemase